MEYREAEYYLQASLHKSGVFWQLLQNIVHKCEFRWVNNMERKTIVGLMALVAIVAVSMFSGCVEETKYEEGAETPTESENLEISDNHTDQIVTYPTRDEVISYVAKINKVPLNEVEIIEFQTIGFGAGFEPVKTIQEGGYVAVSVLVSNYSAVVMAYKDYNNVFIIGNYTASTIEEKNLFDLLKNSTFPSNSVFYGKLIPTNITILNSSYLVSRNDTFQVEYGIDKFEDSPYATFEFVSNFNHYHGYWPSSNGLVDVKIKRILIRMQPNR